MASQKQCATGDRKSDVEKQQNLRGIEKVEMIVVTTSCCMSSVDGGVM
jgi:hypothetical protein